MAKVTGTIVYNKGLGEISVDSVTGLISYKKPSGIIVLNAYPLKENRITGSSYGIASIAAILIEAQNPIAGSSYGIATIAAVLTDSAPTYCNEYQNIYDSYDIKPDEADAALDNTMVDGWVNDGVWAKIDGVWIFANHITGVDSLRNWKIPANTATAYNSPAWDQWEGWAGNGSNAYIDLNWNPTSHGVNYILNSASAGCYTRNNVAEMGDDFGVDDGLNDLRFISRWISDIAVIRVNSSTNSIVANIDSRGMWIENRVLSNYQDLYNNKVRIINGNINSTGVPNLNIYALCANFSGTPNNFSTRQQSMIFVGSGLTQTDINNITNRFHTRMDAHGKAV